MTDLPAGLRAALTLGVLAVLLLVMLTWGWSNATAPLPARPANAADARCTATWLTHDSNPRQITESRRDRKNASKRERVK